MRTGLATVFLAAAVAAAGFAAPAFSADKVGVSAAVRGTVLVKSAARSRGAASGEAMFLGDQVASKAASGMQIMLLDETTFTIGADCDLTIDEFVYNPAQGAGSISATVSKGALRYVSGLVAKDGPDRVKLKTPSSTIGLRGTSLVVVAGADAIRLAALLGYDVSGADPKTATLAILRGPGQDRTSTDTRGGARVDNAGGGVNLDKAGYATFVPSRNVAPLPPVRMTDDAERALDGLLAQKSVARNGGSGGVQGGSGVEGSGQTWVEGRPFDLPHDQFDKGQDSPFIGVRPPIGSNDECDYSSCYRGRKPL